MRTVVFFSPSPSSSALLDPHIILAAMASAEPASTKLQPAAHRERFLHLQSAARYAGSSDPTARLNSILALLEAYRNAADLTSLLPHDWDIFLALETRLAAATSPLTPDSLQAVFELHKTLPSTTSPPTSSSDTSASSLHTSLSFMVSTSRCSLHGGIGRIIDKS